MRSALLRAGVVLPFSALVRGGKLAGGRSSTGDLDHHQELSFRADSTHADCDDAAACAAARFRVVSRSSTFDRRRAVSLPVSVCSLGTGATHARGSTMPQRPKYTAPHALPCGRRRGRCIIRTIIRAGRGDSSCDDVARLRRDAAILSTARARFLSRSDFHRSEPCDRGRSSRRVRVGRVIWRR